MAIQIGIDTLFNCFVGNEFESFKIAAEDIAGRELFQAEFLDENVNPGLFACTALAHDQYIVHLTFQEVQFHLQFLLENDLIEDVLNDEQSNECY